MKTETTENQLAVITGASSGIGYELAKVFAKNGFDLIVCAEDAGIIEAAEAFRREGGKVEVVQADLATKEGNTKLCEAMDKVQVDTVVLNAGVGVSGEFVDTDIEREIKMVELNVNSVLRLAKHVLADFVRRGHGRILITSSIAGEMPGPYFAVYAATKAFLQSFTEAIRYEVKDKGIIVTSLQPGATDTNFFARANMLDTKAGQAKKDDPADVAQDGFDALMAGKDHVVAGSFMNRVVVGVAKVTPETFGAAQQAKDVKPNSAPKH